MSVRQVEVAEAIRLRDTGFTVVDVREPVEWNSGHIPGAVHIPLGELPSRLATDLPDHAAGVLLHCRSGARSRRAAEFMAASGYTGVVNYGGLLTDWQAAGGAWEEPAHALTPDQERRYARQLVLPEVGPDGQRRLLEARVLLLGAGGLGSPVALYLAAAGVGTLGVVDADAVDESNLQRQVIHRTADIGASKVESAARALAGLNPDVQVVKRAVGLNSGNADDLLDGWDVVIDGSDNLETRYALNDAAVRRRVPVVHGSVYRWEGVVTTFVPVDGPCYRCLHPTMPPAELFESCEVAGVLGVLPGIVGTLQATEAIKLILGAGRTLVGRLLTIDARDMTLNEVALARDPACPACGGAARATAPPM
ncbi:MAG: molybdopterin-synthase adenylyltransferase MoeB [Chloroflexi bacterium]|nr:molybdopterin-synthase adenylyltransferase MoeB [Chloroflexota bacterium]